MGLQQTKAEGGWPLPAGSLWLADHSGWPKGWGQLGWDMTRWPVALPPPIGSSPILKMLRKHLHLTPLPYLDHDLLSSHSCVTDHPRGIFHLPS